MKQSFDRMLEVRFTVAALKEIFLAKSYYFISDLSPCVCARLRVCFFRRSSLPCLLSLWEYLSAPAGKRIC